MQPVTQTSISYGNTRDIHFQEKNAGKTRYTVFCEGGGGGGDVLW